MIKIFVDSGSSIKKEEREKYNVEVLPLKILLDDKEYLDGEDLDIDVFYDALINKGIFPKTSLPSLEDAENRVSKSVSEGFDVIILPISSGISGTHNALNMLFKDNPKVRVVDTKTAVAGIKILVKEANKYTNQPLDYVVEKLNEIIPRIRALAVPETLEYMHKGGRLSKTAFAVSKVLRIKPVLELRYNVKVAGKTIGLKSAMKFILNELEKCDTNYPIVPSYTYSKENLNELVSKTNKKYVDAMIDYDNLDPAIAAYWGPSAFGYVYVEKNNA